MNLGRLTELRQRLLFLLGALIVYRIGTFIPVPGIDPSALAALFDVALIGSHAKSRRREDW